MSVAGHDSSSADLARGGLPPELQASVERHSRHLGELVDSLRAAGFGEDLIDTSVRNLVSSYGDELAAAIRTLGEGRANV